MLTISFKTHGSLDTARQQWRFIPSNGSLAYGARTCVFPIFIAISREFLCICSPCLSRRSGEERLERKSVAGRKQSAPQSFVIMCSFHQDRTGTRTDFQPEGTGSSMPIYRSCTRGIDECIEQASASCRSSPRAAGRSAGNRSPIGRTAHAGLAGSTYATMAEEPDPF